MKPCVWLRMENRVFRKIIYFDRKIAYLTRKIFSASVLPSNHFRRHAKRERERERTHRHANRERERERERERSCRRVRDCADQIAVLIPSTRRWDRAMNPWTDRPTSSTGEIAPWTHEPIDPSLILIDEPTNRSRHDWSCDFDFFCFDFCFLCCLYASIICNNICLDSKKMWETW